MSQVVFLRAANVGGKNVFRPAALVKALAKLDMINVGAAGTFVVRGKASVAEIRRAVLAQLPFEPALAVVKVSEVLALVESEPFAGVRFSKSRRGWVAVMDKKPRLRPRLPVVVPAGRAWQVRLERAQGRFALGLWQRGTGGFVFPSHVVERALGVSATTRWWETLERVAAIVRG